VQNYTYDSVNRLNSTTEEGVWSQSYAYDAFGNRWVSSSSGVTVSALTPTNENWYERDVNNTPTNRLAGTNNYDPRGNLTVHGSHTLTYDGEDRLVAASGATPSAKYEYDGEGRRVLAHSCSGTTPCTPGPNANTTIFVYDAFGRLAMEYRAEAATAGTSYYTRDHLGSTRLETNASGQQVKCSDFLPFGEEIAAGTGGRPSCFNANDNKVKFTGKERDAETGLDYFLARYFSSAQGRFTSPDPLLASARLTDPQTWNRYAYVRNDPVNLVDPDGRISIDPSTFQYYQSLGWKPQEILNLFDGLPGADWSNSFYYYWDAGMYFNQNFWDYRNDQVLPRGVIIETRVIGTGETNRGEQAFDKPDGPVDGITDASFDLINSATALRGVVTIGVSIARSVSSISRMARLLADETGALSINAPLKVTFGHGARHLAGTGLTSDAVEAAIRTDVLKIAGESSATGNFWSTVVVEGQTIQYRAYTRGANLINIGTYMPVP